MAELVTQRCSTCGFRSDVAGFFRRERAGFRRRLSPICAGCEAFKPDAAESKAMAGASAGLILLAFVIFRYVIDYGALIEGVAFLIGAALGLSAAVMVHEMGHALAARALGRSVLSIRVGGGPLARSIRVLGAVLEWRRHAFLGGLVRYDGGVRPSRQIQALIAAAGPLANLAWAGLLAALPALLRESGDALPLSAACAGAALTSAYVGVINLLLFRHQAPGLEGAQSDGAQILAAFTRRPPVADEGFLMAEAERLSQLRRFDEAAVLYKDLLARRPGDLIALGQLMHVVDRGQGPAAALECYQTHALNGPPRALDWTLASAEALLRANIVWMALKAGGEANLATAERFAPLPTDGENAFLVAVATQGALEVRRGAPEAGEPLLLIGLRSEAVELEDRAAFCAFLAEGRRMRGDEATARAFDALGRRLLARV